MSEDIQDNVDLKKKNNGFVLKIHRDIEGTRIYAKSEALHKLLSMFANGKKSEYATGKYVWKYGNEYPDIVGAFTGNPDIHNLLNNCKLDEGVEISFSRPVSRKYLEDLAKNIQKLVESTIQNYSSAIRISVNVDVSDPLIRWDRNIPEVVAANTVSRNSF